NIVLNSGTSIIGESDLTLEASENVDITGSLIRLGNYEFSGSSDVFVMPLSDGYSGDVLSTDGYGNLSFINVPSGEVATLSEVLSEGNTAGGTDIIFDNGESIRTGYSSDDKNLSLYNSTWNGGFDYFHFVTADVSGSGSTGGFQFSGGDAGTNGN